MAQANGSRNGSRKGERSPYEVGQEEGPKDPLTIRQFVVFDKYSASLWTWVAAAILLFTCLFHIISFSTNGWVTVISYQAGGLKHIREIGLWQQCESNGVGCHYFRIEELSDAFRATQAFAVFSFICMFVSVSVTSLYLLTNAKEKDPRLVLIAVISRCLTVLFLLLTIAIFGARWADKKYDRPEYSGELGYSYGLEVFCFLLEIAGCGFMVFELMQLINLMAE